MRRIIAFDNVSADGYFSAADGSLGWVTPDARTAFTCVCARGGLTACDLAALLDWMVARAEAALATLAGRRLLLAEDDRYLPLPIA